MADEKTQNNKPSPGTEKPESSRFLAILEKPSHYRVPISFAIVIAIIAREIITGTAPRVYTFKDPWSIVGVILVLMGVGLRSWSAGIIMKSQALATTGPYALTRHPLYLGSLFLACGFLILIGRLENVLIIIAAALLLYLPVIHREERFLADKFKRQWDDYVEQTAGVFPKKLSALKAVWAPWSFAQWLKNREYRCAVGALIALAAFAFF
jgi:protein-S-isoprenylcysteine O-methyltransferase Ste14